MPSLWIRFNLCHDAINMFYNADFLLSAHFKKISGPPLFADGTVDVLLFPLKIDNFMVYGNRSRFLLSQPR